MTEVVKALETGDEEAIARFVHEHAPRMLQVARRLLGNEADAADAVQDALVSALGSIGGFDGRSRLSTWLHRIVVNAALMRLRARKRRRERSLEDLLPSFYEDGHRVAPLPAWTPTVEELAGREETRQMIARCLDDLPEDYRTVVVLRDIEGLDTEQTAQVLGLSPGAVKTRLHRTRQALRTMLERELRGESR